jgi:hypothetical protein
MTVSPTPRTFTTPRPHSGRLRRTTAALTVLGTALTTAAVLAVGTAPAHASTARYEAESATLSGGADVEHDHTGYSGSGFVGGFTDQNQGTARVTFQVTVPDDGPYDLALGYSDGTSTARTVSLAVDGGSPQQVRLPATDDWDAWATVTIRVTLTAGSHSVAYSYGTGDNGNANLDYLDVSGADGGTGTNEPSTGPLFEAEDATFAGGAVVQNDHTGFTGSGFVGGFTDGFKGNAAVSFGVAVATAGDHDLALRYANGTGSTRTFTLTVDGASRQVSLPATAGWDSWATVTQSVFLDAGDHTVTYAYGVADNGNANLDSLTVTATDPTDPGDPGDPPAAGSGEAEDAFLSGGTEVATTIGGFAGTGYVHGFQSDGARVVRTLAADTTGAQDLTVRFANTSGATRDLAVLVNGRNTGTLALANGSGWQDATVTVALRAGLNTVQLRAAAAGSDVAIDSLTADDEGTLASRGATLPYTEYEAENGALVGGATVLGPDRTYGTVAAEASGREAVHLGATGQGVSVTLTEPANAITVRYSIPDTGDGAGRTAPLAVYADGTKVADLSTTSVYSWVYGAYPYTNVPSQGSPHHYFDEARVRVGDLAAGTVLTLRKDSDDTAGSYDIDLVDAEIVPAAAIAPTGAVSITSYGAATDGSDSASAIDAAISAAKAQGSPVWIPQGTFTVSRRIDVAGVTILGAGPWYTAIRGKDGKGGFFATGSDVTLADFAILGDVRYRDDQNFDAALEGNFGSGSLVQNLWIEHTKVGAWVDSGTRGLLMTGLRIRDTFADGVNLHGDVQDTRVEQSTVRNTGDDGLAMFSEGSPVTRSAFVSDTIQAPMLANGVGIYGGASNAVTDTLVADTVTASAGIAVSTRFSPVPFSGTTTVARDTLTRTGGYEPNWASQLGALWIYADTADITTPVRVTDVRIDDSTYQGVLISYARTVTGAAFDGVTIDGSGTYGIELNAQGSSSFTDVTVSGSGSGGLDNLTGYTLVRGSGNSGF